MIQQFKSITRDVNLLHGADCTTPSFYLPYDTCWNCWLLNMRRKSYSSPLNSCSSLRKSFLAPQYMATIFHKRSLFGIRLHSTQTNALCYPLAYRLRPDSDLSSRRPVVNVSFRLAQYGLCGRIRS